VKYRAHTDFDDFSEILWPEKFNEERLKFYRSGYVYQGIPEGYSQEYLNYPIAESTAFFRKDDFGEQTADDRKLPKTYYAAIDLAISEKDKRSYTVITVGGVDPQGMLHIETVIRKRMDSMEIVQEMMAVQIKFKPDLFVIEDGALAKSIGPYLKQEMLRQGTFINLYPKVPDKDKRSRARAIQGRMRQGGVKFNKEAEWYLAFEQELLRFDRGEYDDQVDSIAWLGLVLNEMVESPTDEEIADMDFEEEIATFMDQQSYSGRSTITGY
jgi:predicted phage terminase large subunit-like protein